MTKHEAPEVFKNSGLYANGIYLYFDIETIPSQDPALLETLKSEVKAPATYKKPESINAWLKDNRESAAKEALSKTSFDGGRGHVCTISWAKNDGDIQTAHAETVAQERDVVAAFFEAFDAYHSETLVGHNIGRFDIPFLKKRAVALGIKMPGSTSFPRDPKPWSKSIEDTMVMWAGDRDMIGMDALCDILGIPGKGDFDGSMVADAWAGGKHETIRAYAAKDVERTREIHKRFLLAGW